MAGQAFMFWPRWPGQGVVSRCLPMEAATQTPNVIGSEVWRAGEQGAGSDLLPRDHQLHDFVMTVSFCKPLGLGVKPGSNLPLSQLQGSCKNETLMKTLRAAARSPDSLPFPTPCRILFLYKYSF